MTRGNSPTRAILQRAPAGNYLPCGVFWVWHKVSSWPNKPPKGAHIVPGVTPAASPVFSHFFVLVVLGGCIPFRKSFSSYLHSQGLRLFVWEWKSLLLLQRCTCHVHKSTHVHTSVYSEKHAQLSLHTMITHPLIHAFVALSFSLCLSHWTPHPSTLPHPHHHHHHTLHTYKYKDMSFCDSSPQRPSASLQAK